ncbi:uncharacterized protein [Procambarus clarkii]|uniref:uncharacterized protein n=1 Tax=Procambarus clarkii TaxID=6728 RepID=UPI0037427658
MDTAGKMKRTFTDLKDHLTRQINICYDLSEQPTVNYFELESYFQAITSKFKQIRGQINRYLTELAKTQATEAELDDDIINLAQYGDDIYVRLQPFIKLFALNKLTTASSNIAQPEVKLPLISLPTFSGTEDECWDDFWNKFSSVASKPSIPKTTKFIYIQDQLKGEALKAISTLTLTSDCYDLAVQFLKSNFANTLSCYNLSPKTGGFGIHR